ncbi:uncharacterized protein N0V89_001182 [Didymosphaeria variabile]|uniref:Uncharacterized protein n=1 Tax=Didymosphaeria variabile TaxID=1932322 RepID=A0A9W8XWJ5_9PLEO|nr:uncharacterized protein N0V89_001182 [Didymosphaeria variabile]KAJ4360616.1 hypothetical protein N0V89_001182 [Didymosphaeria variabile]
MLLLNATTFVNEPAHTPQPVPPTRSCQPVTQPIAYKPQILHEPHPDSKILQDFHWVPYPLGLLPKERKVSAHLRKAYLVAERLSWEDELITAPDRNLNEELNWAVNYELGILEPFVEDIEQRTGGKRSQKNKYHPYQNAFEMKEALKLIFTSENITDASWNLWVDLQKDIQRITENEELASTSSPARTSQNARKAPLSEISANARPKTPPAKVEEIDLTMPPQSALGPTSEGPAPPLPTPPASLPVADNAYNRFSLRGYDQASLALPGTDKEAWSGSEHASHSSVARCILSYKTLPDFYSLLDQIERTSYVGALFLEAYAERLRDDMCKDCWFERYVEGWA